MHWESFFIPREYIDGKTVSFPPEEVKHLSKVLRTKVGDAVWAVDGEGTAYRVQVTRVGRNQAEGEIVQTRRRLGEPVSQVTLAQAVLKGNRFNWLVEKTTEIGVCRIIPMLTEHTEKEVSPQKLARWRRLAIAAMKQSGRSLIPDITRPIPLRKVCSLGAGCRFRLIAEATSESHPLQIQKTSRRSTTRSKAILMVGPEGGFTEAEIIMAREHGYLSVNLGPRRLRSETAGLILSSLVLFHLQELG